MMQIVKREFKPRTLSKKTPKTILQIIKPSRDVNRVFLHCSASDNPAHDDISVIKQWHLARAFKDIGYHFFIRKDGAIQLGRPLSQIPAAQFPFNEGTIAICLHGLEEKKFTISQFDTLKALCDVLHNLYQGEISFHGHCEVNPQKTCPVFNFKKVLNLDVEGYLI